MALTLHLALPVTHFRMAAAHYGGVTKLCKTGAYRHNTLPEGTQDSAAARNRHFQSTIASKFWLGPPWSPVCEAYAAMIECAPFVEVTLSRTFRSKLPWGGGGGGFIGSHAKVELILM
jgi:hypothetical protein